jgi:hypothetical protein
LITINGKRGHPPLANQKPRRVSRPQCPRDSLIRDRRKFRRFLLIVPSACPPHLRHLKSAIFSPISPHSPVTPITILPRTPQNPSLHTADPDISSTKYRCQTQVSPDRASCPQLPAMPTSPRLAKAEGNTPSASHPMPQTTIPFWILPCRHPVSDK